MSEIDWRRMPALTALRAFAATASEGGFSAAARKLNVTHAAIAQQVRALEADLDVPLVWRDGKHLHLTPEGERFAKALADGFSMIQSAAEMLRADTSEKALSVTVPPVFASEWLMPRLARFWKRHPDIPLSLLPDPRVVDLKEIGANIGIRFGVGKWSGVISEFLTAAPQVVVAAPELLGGRKKLSLREMAMLPWVREGDWPEQMQLLESMGLVPAAPELLGGRKKLSLREMAMLPWVREGDWPEQMQLLESMGLVPAALKFVDFPNEELALAAAREGIGLHLETEALIVEDLKIGWLVKIHELTEESLGYYIVRPPGRLNPAAKTFIEWLKAET